MLAGSEIIQRGLRPNGRPDIWSGIPIAGDAEISRARCSDRPAILRAVEHVRHRMFMLMLQEKNWFIRESGLLTTIAWGVNNKSWNMLWKEVFYCRRLSNGCATA